MTAASDHPAPLTIGSTRFAWGERTFVMGILNVTPDSFSGDGLGDGDALVARAVDQGRRMVAEGADLLDVGGESTRPGHEPVDADAEARRVVPVVAALRAALPSVPLSIDTSKVDVAEAALDAGADLLNDVRATRSQPGLAELAAARGVPLILMHGRDVPGYDDVVAEVVAELRSAIEGAVARGVSETSLIVDPGIGFGKSADDNVRLLRELPALRELGRPILLGTSRKSTLGRILDLPPTDRVEATLATTALGIAAGVDLVRVHDVRANVRAARVSDAIVRGRWRAEPAQGGPP